MELSTLAGLRGHAVACVLVEECQASARSSYPWYFGRIIPKPLQQIGQARQ
jgi:hypothetical protein